MQPVSKLPEEKFFLLIHFESWRGWKSCSPSAGPLVFPRHWLHPTTFDQRLSDVSDTR